MFVFSDTGLFIASHIHYSCLFIKINFNLHKFTGFTLEKTKKYPRNENSISWKSTENTVSQVMENSPNTNKIAE